MRLAAFFLFLIASVTIQANAADRDVRGSKDHDLISRYPSSVIKAYEYRDYEAVSLPLGSISGHRKNYQADNAVDLEGRLTRIVYKVKDKTSTLKVYRNFEKALKSEGFEELFACAGDKCGNQGSWGYALGQLGLLNGKQRTIRYLAVKKALQGETAFVGVYVMEKANGSVMTGLSIIETKEMESDLITVDPASLQQQLAEHGKVAVYGIHFDVDRAELRQESAETLEKIDQLLEADNTLKLYIVGHTDDAGSQSHNLDLSNRRAKAVVNELVDKYGVAAERLTAFGAGPYAPVASNDNEAGKAKNRRVELVKRIE